MLFNFQLEMKPLKDKTLVYMWLADILTKTYSM